MFLVIKNMTYQERIKQYPLHQSQRGWFGFELYKQMAENKDIYLLVGDLGYSIFDFHRDDFAERFINCSASEQAMLGIAVGLALKGKIPFCYSITTFLLYRPFETIKLYADHEKIPIKLVGSGRDKDYIHDGVSHDASDIYEEQPAHNNLFVNVISYWPENKEEIPKLVEEIVYNKMPTFISLKR